MAEALRDIIASTGWILSSLLHPIRAGRDIKGFFKEMWHSLKALGIMLWKTPLKSLANFFGGFLYFIMHHSVEFTAQTTLLVVCGFAVIGKAVDAVDSALTSLPFVTGSANGIGSVRHQCSSHLTRIDIYA